MRRRCPICKSPVEPWPGNRAYPFCSSRCRQVDLGCWFEEVYVISRELDVTTDAEVIERLAAEAASEEAVDPEEKPS